MNTTGALLAMVGAGLLVLAGCQGAARGRAGEDPVMSASGDRQAIERTLDDLHDAAAHADEGRYFALFAPEAVFLGTDASERWTLEQFKAYAHPHFAAGRGWTYIPQQRWVGIGPDGRTAWFDETLTNAKLGLCRGSGALVKGGDGAWRVVQYNLTMPVPNDLIEGVAQRIRAGSARPAGS